MSVRPSCQRLRLSGGPFEDLRRDENVKRRDADDGELDSSVIKDKKAIAMATTAPENGIPTE